MNKFIVDGQYKQLLNQNGFDTSKILKAAKLPENLFTKEQIRLNESEYYDLMNAISDYAPNEQNLANLSVYEGIETFSAPILAAYCSENGIKCIERLSRYKQLIGPILYQINKQKDEVTVTLLSASNQEIQSNFFIEGEFAFLVNLLSKATEQEIRPIKVTATDNAFATIFIELIGKQPEQATTNSITFSEKDLNLPFLTDNQSLQNYLIPELDKRLSELDVDDSFSAQVRSSLVDLLPAGESSIDEVAQKLNVSKRTLQRKLKAEGTNFQSQLNNIRETLAKSYLRNTKMNSDEIAYLLGYLEVNSFLRAFSVWTDMSISEYRKMATMK